MANSAKRSDSLHWDQDQSEHRLSRDYFTGKVPQAQSGVNALVKEETWALLMREPDLDLTEIELDIDNGVVVLTGTVADPAAKRRLENLLLGCPGVESVRNELHVLKKLDALPDTASASTT